MSALDKRENEPGPDDIKITEFRITFAVPVFISSDQQKAIHDIFDRITMDLKNQPVNGVHWLSGWGSMPQWSKIDSLFLGKPIEPGSPISGDPTFRDDVLSGDTSAREFGTEKERARVKLRRAKATEGGPPCPSS